MNIKKNKTLFFIIFVLILVQTIYSLDNNLYVTAKYSKKEVCPCTTVVYKFDIKNIGSFSEIYTLTADKEFTPWITLSKNNILLDPGQSTKVYAYLTPDCDLYGHYQPNFYVRTTYTKLKAKVPVKLNIKPCYDYDVTFKDYKEPYTICENEIKSIPIVITNNAHFTNSYKLKLHSPKWAYLDYNRVQLPSNKKATLNIVLMPPIGLEDTSIFTLDVVSERGKIKQQYTLNIDVDNCYIPDIEPTDFVINYDEAFNDLNIINTGTKKATYSLALDAQDWITLEPDSITVEPGKTKTVKLHTTPTEETRKGKYEASLVTVVQENNAEYQHTLHINLKTPRLIGKFLLYSGLIFLLILVVLIIISLLKRIKPEKIKPVEKVLKKKEEEPKIEEKPEKKIPKKTKRKIIFGALIFMILWLITINLLALQHKITFEVPKNVTVPEVIPKVAKVNATYYEQTKDKIIDTGSSIWNFVKTYYLYLIIGIVSLAIIIFLIILITKKLKKIKRAKEAKEKKVVEKKIEKPKIRKKFKIKLPKKTIIRIVIAIAIAIVLIIVGITLWNFIKLYSLYLIIAFVLLAITIFFIILIKKKKIKPKVKKEVKEKKVVEKKIKPKVKPEKKKEKRKKISKKTLKRLLIASIIFVILMAFALYVTLNYEEIKIQKAEKNFIEKFFDKTKNIMGTSLNINFTKLIKPEEPVIVPEPGIPQQKWQINTIHTLDLSKYFSDPDNDPLTYSSTQPENIAIEIENSIATFSPEYNWTGINTITFIATDSRGGTTRSNNVYLVVQEEVTSSKFNEFRTKVINFFVDIKDYFVFYLNYIIAGFVILIILILIITYNKRLLKFLEEEKPKKKRKK